jgi:hypothetical protein
VPKGALSIGRRKALPTHYTMKKNLVRHKQSSLFVPTVSDEENMSNDFDTWGLYYKTFLGCS